MQLAKPRSLNLFIHSNFETMYYHIVKAFDRYVSPIIRIGPSPNRKITDTQCRFRMCKHYIMSITTLRSLPV